MWISITSINETDYLVITNTILLDAAEQLKDIHSDLNIEVIDIMDGSDYRVKNNPESQYNDYYYAPYSTILSELFNFLSANKNLNKSEHIRCFFY